MLTWSSLPALEGIESTLAGWQSTLFSLTSDALATCAIMKPECSPLPGARNGVSPVDSAGFTSCSTRRSLMFASSATAIAARSSASASGCPWKLPPLMMSAAAVVEQEDARVVGDRVDLALEHPAHPRRARRGVAPCTCGMHRRLYASCTLPQCLWLSMISLSASRARRLAATAACPG